MLTINIRDRGVQQFVDQVMELVEMTPLENAIVGLPGVSGLSTEQRKRLTIAVELVANPSIIFMDEPTSGLDARAAAIVMRAVRNTVDTGRTVVCTIHQPSIDIFEAFDEVRIEIPIPGSWSAALSPMVQFLSRPFFGTRGGATSYSFWLGFMCIQMLLLKRGGRTIYFGPLGRQSHKLVEYFESVPGVQKIKEGINPATWMLEASNVSVETQLGIDFADIYQNSALSQ